MENRDTNRNLYTSVYRSTVLKGPNDPLVDEWISKCDIFPYKRILFLKRNEILTWIYLEDIMLSGISQTQKVKHNMTSLR